MHWVDFNDHCSLDGVTLLGRDFVSGAFTAFGKSFIMHITRLDIITLDDVSVHSSSSTILSTKPLHFSLMASVRIIIKKTD